MTQPITPLKGRHQGSDIYVIGSGPSLNYINTNFFTDKIVICINHTISHIKTAQQFYLVAKEPNKSMQDIAAKKKALIVTCKHHSGVPKNPVNQLYHPDITYIFEPKTSIIKDTNNNVALERSSSTIVSGLHLAAFLGAKTIILVGHDCGFIDGNMHVNNYSKEKAVMKGKGYVQWMNAQKVENKSIQAKALLEQYWGVNVYSLNPFINFNLEGHVYKKFG